MDPSALSTLVAVVLSFTSPLASQVTPAEPSRAPTEATQPTGLWPLDPRPDVVHPFDPPDMEWGAGHRGVDLAGRPGQVVRAAMAGEVGFVGAIGGKPVVTVLHGDRRTTYEPVVASVAKGDRVLAGDPLGRLVTRSSHCFPATCLHWGLIEGETYLDPLSLLGAQEVRLLPLWRDEPVR